MKKLLVASTALVAVAAVSSANAADPIKISVGGYMNQVLGYVDQDEDGQQDFAEVLLHSETELYFRGSTKLDNGLTVGVNIDRYSDRGDSGGDDVFLSISGDSLGTIKLGQTKPAGYGLSHAAPNVALGNNDGDVEDYIKDTVVTSNQTHTASESNDGNKIVYLTPNFGGVQAGFSYGLDRNSAGLDSVVDVGGNGGCSYSPNGTATNKETCSLNDTAADFGIAYNGDFDGVSVGADVTYQRNFNGGTTGTGVADRKSTRAGLSVGVAGFTVGGSYRVTKNEKYVEDQDSTGWDAGVSYATGPYAVSFSYMSLEEDDDGTAAAQEDTAKQWVLGASYDLGAGVTAIGSVFAAEYDDADKTAPDATEDNEGFGVAAGLKVSF
jgi:predicted porin